MKKEAPNKFCKHFEKKTEYSAESSDIRAEEKRRKKNRLGTIYLLGERNRCLRNNQSLSVSWKVSNSICLSACLPACLPGKCLPPTLILIKEKPNMSISCKRECPNYCVLIS
jgi:hypothetical protein